MSKQRNKKYNPQKLETLRNDEDLLLDLDECYFEVRA